MAGPVFVARAIVNERLKANDPLQTRQQFKIDVRHCLIPVRYLSIVGCLSRHNNSAGFDPTER